MVACSTVCPALQCAGLVPVRCSQGRPFALRLVEGSANGVQVGVYSRRTKHSESFGRRVGRQIWFGRWAAGLPEARRSDRGADRVLACQYAPRFLIGTCRRPTEQLPERFAVRKGLLRSSARYPTSVGRANEQAPSLRFVRCARPVCLRAMLGLPVSERRFAGKPFG